MKKKKGYGQIIILFGIFFVGFGSLAISNMWINDQAYEIEHLSKAVAKPVLSYEKTTNQEKDYQMLTRYYERSKTRKPSNEDLLAPIPLQINPLNTDDVRDKRLPKQDMDAVVGTSLILN